MDAELHEYGKTKLTEAEWVKLAAKRRGAWVLVIDGRVVAEGTWLKMTGQLLLSTHAGQRVKMLSHTDFVKARLRQLQQADLVDALLGESAGGPDSDGPIPGCPCEDCEEMSEVSS